jgi:hypothetical protein
MDLSASRSHSLFRGSACFFFLLSRVCTGGSSCLCRPTPAAHRRCQGVVLDLDAGAQHKPGGDQAQSGLAVDGARWTSGGRRS